jgi:transcriptional regulator with XRE-family HTH domain
MTGEELKILREKAGLTQIELAEKIGTFHPVISGWENGKHKISRAYLRILKSFFKV